MWGEVENHLGIWTAGYLRRICYLFLSGSSRCLVIGYIVYSNVFRWLPAGWTSDKIVRGPGRGVMRYYQPSRIYPSTSGTTCSWIWLPVERARCVVISPPGFLKGRLTSPVAILCVISVNTSICLTEPQIHTFRDVMNACECLVARLLWWSHSDYSSCIMLR